MNFSENLVTKGISEVVKVVGVQCAVDTDDWQVEIEFCNMLNGIVELEMVECRDMNLKTISRIMIQKGLVMYNHKTVYGYIIRKVVQLITEKNAQNAINSSVSLVHSGLGWYMWNSDFVFKGWDIFTSEGTVFSTYIGNADIESGGDLEEYVDMLRQWVCGNTKMEGICCMAAAATVLLFANQIWGTSIDNPINHLVGNSTTGKTTAAELFASFGSSPDGDGSMMLSFMDTQNAILKKIGSNKGYPVAIDEFSTGGSRKFWTDFIYMLANGVGKARCSAGGAGVQSVERFSTTFLTTGEMSLLKKCSKNEGIRARLFEFDVDFWTRSATEADRIKAIARKDYGLVTPMVAQALLADSDWWFSRFKMWRRIIRKKIKGDELILGIGDRVTDIVALYLTSGEILNQALSIRLNMSYLFSFFYKHLIYKNAEDANLGVRAYSAIMAYYVMNKSRFVDESYVLGLAEGDHLILPDIDGYVVDVRKRKINKKSYNRCIVFYPEVLEKILLNRGFSDERIALKQVQQEGLLKTKDKSRTYDTEMLEGMRQNVYKVLIYDATYN